MSVLRYLTMALIVGCAADENHDLPVDTAPEDTGLVDADRDGWTVDEDCDDTDPAVNGGAEEVPYDGHDNDCDASTPDDDLDGDGFELASDCDDTDAGVHPDAIERTADGVDNDCDGDIDCDDTDLVHGSWVGDLWETDVPDFCVGFCTRTVAGALSIRGSSFTDLGDLVCLTEISGGVLISGNQQLRSLDGLEALTAANTDALLRDGEVSLGGFTVDGNPRLTSLAALEGLVYAGITLTVSDNEALTSLRGLEGLSYVSNLYIENNDGLTSLIGLDGLTATGEGCGGIFYYSCSLRITGNDGLTSLMGLGNLTSVGGGLIISDNGALATLSGLEHLTRTDGLWVSTNATLVDVTALYDLESCYLASITNNITLTDAAAQALIDEIGDIQDVTVYGNG